MTQDNRYSLSEFVNQNSQRDRGQGFFELESPRMLEVNLQSNYVWTKMGAMVGYKGQINFTREGIAEHGLGKMFKKALTGEGLPLTKAEGMGQLYLADLGKEVQVLSLNNESVSVNGNDVLAFEPSLNWDIKLMRKVAGMMSGGLFNVTFQGSGMLAITTHYDPMVLRVTPQTPVFTDPQATVAWSGNLQPDFKTDIQFKTLLGRGSGESLQMMFQGDGFVVIQPYEEVYYTQGTA